MCYDNHGTKSNKRRLIVILKNGKINYLQLAQSAISIAIGMKSLHDVIVLGKEIYKENSKKKTVKEVKGTKVIF